MSMERSSATGLLATLGGIIVHDEEIGISTYVLPGQKVAMRLPFQRALTRSAGEGIDFGPVTTLLDTICGVTALAGLGFRESTATLDLRLDYLASAPPGEDILAEAQVDQLFGSESRGSVLISASAHSAESGRMVAQSLGRFHRKDAPKPEAPHRLRSDRLIDSFDNYDAFMGFLDAPDGELILPYRTGLIGNGSLPSLHGGVLATLLLEAARRRMQDTQTPQIATAHVTFQIYGGPRDVIASVQTEKLGRSVSFVSARCAHPGIGQTIAKASFTFVADRSTFPTIIGACNVGNTR